MLRVKDNVDLKELEKYGFEYRDCCEYKNSYVYVEKNDGWSNDEIVINCDNGEIYKHYEDFSNDYLQYKINDLIKDGLVEKVVSNNAFTQKDRR